MEYGSLYYGYRYTAVVANYFSQTFVAIVFATLIILTLSVSSVGQDELHFSYDLRPNTPRESRLSFLLATNLVVLSQFIGWRNVNPAIGTRSC